LRETSVVPGLFQLQFPLSPLACHLLLNSIEHTHRDRHAYWRHGFQEGLRDRDIHRARRHALADVRIAVAIALLTHVGRGAALFYGVMLHAHRATADPTAHQALQQGDPFSRHTAVAVRIRVLA
jgi:hypothetical protein